MLLGFVRFCCVFFLGPSKKKKGTLPRSLSFLIQRCGRREACERARKPPTNPLNKSSKSRPSTSHGSNVVFLNDFSTSHGSNLGVYYKKTLFLLQTLMFLLQRPLSVEEISSTLSRQSSYFHLEMRKLTPKTILRCWGRGHTRQQQKVEALRPHESQRPKLQAAPKVGFLHQGASGKGG